VDILSVEDAAKEYLKTTRPAGEQRIADGGQTRVPGSLKFDGLSVGDQLPERQMLLSRGDLVNYAGVAGDANPIHWDENIARLAGLPDVIAHGMLTLGLGAGFVSSWSGDPGAISKYSVRLSAPAVVPADERGDIEFSGRIKSLDPDERTGVVVVRAMSAGKKIFGMATMDIRFA
jgi:acyl dehydratase